MTDRTRTRLWALLGAVTLLAALLLLWPRGASDRSPAASDPAPAHTSLGAPGAAPTFTAPMTLPSGRLAAGAAVDRSRVGLWMLEDPELPVVVADVLISNRFPTHSLPLEPGKVDLLEPNRRYEIPEAVRHRDRSLAEGDLRVLLTGDKFRLVAGESASLIFLVQRRKKPVPVTIRSATAQAVHPTSREPLGPEIALSFRAGDDHIHHARVQPAASVLQDHFGVILVEVEYDYGGEEPGVELLDLHYSPAAPARFTGAFREELVAGSLHIHVGVEVTEPGRYFFDANIFDAKDRPLAALRANPVLISAGLHEVTFELYGRIVYERESPSPFVMRNLRGHIFYEAEDPDRKLMEDWPAPYVTGAYEFDQFTDQEYWDEDKERHVRGLLEEAAKGERNLLKVTVEEATEDGWVPDW